MEKGLASEVKTLVGVWYADNGYEVSAVIEYRSI